MENIIIECNNINRIFNKQSIEKIKQISHREVKFNYNLSEIESVDISMDLSDEVFKIKVYFLDDEEYHENIFISITDMMISL